MQSAREPDREPLPPAAVSGSGAVSPDVPAPAAQNTGGVEAPAPIAPAGGRPQPTPADEPAAADPDSDVDSADPMQLDLPGPVPIHRYSFDGEGNAVRDSVGRADGIALGAQLQDGALALSGVGLGQVQLPPGLFSRLSSVSLEFWLTWSGDENRRFERIFEFGRTSGSPSDPKIESSFFLSPNYDDGARPRLYFRSQTGEESRLSGDGQFPAQQRAHVAVVLDGRARRWTLYLNGKPAGSSAWEQPLASLRDDNAWLGRSQHVRDPLFGGSFDEFRIYDVALSAADVANSYARGPERLAPRPD